MSFIFKRSAKIRKEPDINNIRFLRFVKITVRLLNFNVSKYRRVAQILQDSNNYLASFLVALST